MTGKHSDQGQRYRRHDYQRYRVGLELGNHQQVDQQQSNRVGQPHIAEGFVGNLPFPIPLQAVLVRVAGLADQALLDRFIEPGREHFATQLCQHVEHAVQRAVELTGHIGRHIDHRQQILVVDTGFVQGLLQGYHFR